MNDEMKVLIVEDEPLLASTLAIGSARRGVRRGGTWPPGSTGLAQATEDEFDVIVLDIMLPGLNGYEVLRRMRARGVWTPVLMLTAKDGEYDQTDAFDLGADDYLTKPFSFIVLVARLRALMRRSAPQRPAVLTAGSLSLDPSRREVQRDDTTISLTPREYGLLEYLMRNKDTVVTKTEILQNVWDAHYEGADNVVEVYVGYVRRKIDIPFGTRTIETVRGVGYRLESGIDSRHAAAEPSPAFRAPIPSPIVTVPPCATHDLPHDRQARDPYRPRSSTGRSPAGRSGRRRARGPRARCPARRRSTSSRTLSGRRPHRDVDARDRMPRSVVQQVAQHPRQRRRVTGQPGRLHVGTHVEQSVSRAQPLDLARRRGRRGRRLRAPCRGPVRRRGPAAAGRR